MTMAQEYKTIADELFRSSSEETWDKLEELEQKNMISHGALEASGWSCYTKIFKDASIYGWSCSYCKQFDFYTIF